jgi:hypothetical protein
MGSEKSRIGILAKIKIKPIVIINHLLQPSFNLVKTILSGFITL